jgi:glycosyltransferase involved in cell wall biosynthesis
MMPGMRIGLLSSQRGFYGGEVHLRDLAVGLRERGHRVTCLVRPGSQLAARLPGEGLAVAEVPLVEWCEPVRMTALHRRLRRLQLDILHTHCPRDYFIGAVGTLGLATRNVGTRHQLHPISWAWLKRPFLRRFTAMIAVSEAVRGGLLASGVPAHRTVTVPNGIRPPLQTDDGVGLRRELGLPEPAGPVIGCIGRLCRSKGVDGLLRAAALLQHDWPGLQVVLIGGPGGDAAYVRTLHDLAHDQRLAVHFCGYRDQAERFMTALDVLVVPSRAEPFGLVTVEGMARGVPVIVTDAGGSGEIVRDGREGLLVPPQDPVALAAALRRLLSDHDLRRRCSRAGPQRVAARFTVQHQVAATEQVYKRVLAGAPLSA